MPEGVNEGMRGGLEAMPDWHPQNFRALRDCDTSSQAGDAQVREYSKVAMITLAQTLVGIDIHIVSGMDPSGEGVYFGAWLPQVKNSRQTRATWDARRDIWRLRIACNAVPETLAEPPDDAGRDFTVKGEMTHANGEAKASEARSSLREAVRGVEAARGRLRSEDPDAAVDRWRALVSGRWSLVDHFETDGKRYVLARRNDVTVRGREALSDRERPAGFAAPGAQQQIDRLRKSGFLRRP